MIRIALIALALVTPFFMPWQFAVLISLIASYFLPPVALIVGVLFEVLYGTATIPYALILGVVAMLFMYGVRSFVRARIMSA